MSVEDVEEKRSFMRRNKGTNHEGLCSKTRLVSLLLCIVLILGMLPVGVFAADVKASGYCGGEGDGTNLSWTLDNNGKLTIEGTGAMKDYAFYSSDEAPWYDYRLSITTLELAEGITTIGNYAFAFCNQITGNLIIPNSVEIIGCNAFEKCKGFTGELTIGDNVKSIGQSAFDGCRGFSGDLIIGNGVVSIDPYAFFNCGFTGNLVIGDNVTDIGHYAFYNCDGFSGKLVLGDNVKIIEDYAFGGDFTGELSIPDTVTHIGRGAFEGFSEFTGSLIIPDSVVEIGWEAFRNCTGFTGDLIIGDGVTTIGREAFYGCSGFTGKLTLGDSVSDIQANAFRGCDNITGAYFYGDAPSVVKKFNITDEDSFPENTTLYYIEGKTGWTTPTWNEYDTAVWTPSEEDIPSGGEVPEDSNIPADAAEFNGHYYKVYGIETGSKGAAAWEEAKAHCEELGGYLAVISSQEENDFLLDYIMSVGETNAYFGFTDEAQTGTWKWVDAPETSNYTNWAYNEPSGRSEHYAMFYYGGSYFVNGEWNNGSFGNGTSGDDKNYICEWISDENVPEDTHPTIENFTVNEQPENVTVEVGEQITLGGLVKGNGNNLKAVSVAIRLLADETRGGEWHTGRNANGEAINQNIESFDLSDFNDTVVTAGEAFGNTTLTPGTYVVQAYATNQNGNGFEAEHRITMTIVEKQEEDDDTVLLGDVNSDGEVTALDRFVLGRYINDIGEYLINKIAADINKDGSIDQVDYDILSKFLAAWDNYEDMDSFEVNSENEGTISIDIDTSPTTITLGDGYVFSGEIASVGRPLDFVKITVYNETIGEYCDYAIYDANAIKTYGSSTSFDLSNVPAIITGEGKNIGTSGSGYASEGSKTLYLDKANSIYRIDISGKCMGADKFTDLAQVKVYVAEVPYLSVYDENGNNLNGQTISLVYDGSDSKVVYVETNIAQISAWNDSSNRFKLEYMGQSIIEDSKTKYTYQLVALSNSYGSAQKGEIRFYDVTDTNGTITSKSKKLAWFDVTQEKNPNVPVIAAASIKDEQANRTYAKNLLYLNVGDHNYQNGYVLSVRLKEGSPTVNTWTVYTDDESVAKAYMSDGRVYVQAKKEGFTRLYISHVSKNNYNDVDSAFLYVICDVYVGEKEPDVSVDAYRLTLNSDYYKDDMGYVLVSPNESIIDVGIVDEATGNTYYSGELSTQYEIVCEISDQNFAERCGFNFYSGEILTYIDVDNSIDDCGTFAELLLKNKKTGKYEDRVGIYYSNTYHDGWLGEKSHTSDTSKLEQVRKATANHGLVLRQEASTEVEIFNVQYTYHPEKTKHFPSGYYNVTFEALNGTSTNYGVVAYNSANVKVGSTQIIAAYSPTTPVCRVIYEGGKEILTILSGDIEKSFREMETQKTYISIDVPVDGYLAFESGAENSSVEGTNTIDILLAAFQAGTSLKDLLKGPSLTDYSYIDKQVFASYINKIATSALKKEFVRKFATSGAKEAFNYLVGREEYASILEALRECATSGLKPGFTAFASTVEKGVTFLNPVAYALECTVNEATAIEKANDLRRNWDNDNLLGISFIVMPNAS